MTHNLYAGESLWLIDDSDDSISRFFKWAVWVFVGIVFYICFSCHPILIRSLHDVVGSALITANYTVILSGCWEPWCKTVGYNTPHRIQYEQIWILVLFTVEVEYGSQVQSGRSLKWMVAWAVYFRTFRPPGFTPIRIYNMRWGELYYG